jgi:hypothetical protein
MPSPAAIALHFCCPSGKGAQTCVVAPSISDKFEDSGQALCGVFAYVSGFDCGVETLAGETSLPGDEREAQWSFRSR